jgi:hypothetical protein
MIAERTPSAANSDPKWLKLLDNLHSSGPLLQVADYSSLSESMTMENLHHFFYCTL